MIGREGSGEGPPGPTDPPPIRPHEAKRGGAERGGAATLLICRIICSACPWAPRALWGCELEAVSRGR